MSTGNETNTFTNTYNLHPEREGYHKEFYEDIPVFMYGSLIRAQDLLKILDMSSGNLGAWKGGGNPGWAELLQTVRTTDKLVDMYHIVYPYGRLTPEFYGIDLYDLVDFLPKYADSARKPTTKVAICNFYNSILSKLPERATEALQPEAQPAPEEVEPQPTTNTKIPTPKDVFEPLTASISEAVLQTVAAHITRRVEELANRGYIDIPVDRTPPRTLLSTVFNTVESLVEEAGWEVELGKGTSDGARGVNVRIIAPTYP